MIFLGVRRFDVACLGIVDAGMFPRRIADVIPGEQSGQYRADTGDDEGQPPRSEISDQPRYDDRTQCRTQRSAAIEQRGAAAAFVLGLIQIALSLPPAG